MAADEAPVQRAHFPPFQAVHRPAAGVAKHRAQRFGADFFSGVLNMAGGAGKIQLAAALVIIFPAFFIGGERFRFIRNFDFYGFAA